MLEEEDQPSTKRMEVDIFENDDEDNISDTKEESDKKKAN